MRHTTKYTLNGSSGDDHLDGSTLDSAIQAGGLIINGNAGNDIITGGSGADVLNGGDGNDLINGDLADLNGAGGNGNVVWDGGKGSDTLDLSALPYGTGNGTELTVSYVPHGTSGIATNIAMPDGFVWGPTSHDALYQNNFQNFENFTLGAGNDYIAFDTSNVNNVVHAGAGDDFVNGGGGNDTVYGDDGNDMIDGGWGSDLLYGGAGSDIFIWEGRVVNQYTSDTIADFQISAADGSHDQIWLVNNWQIQWDANSPDLLHGYLIDNGTVFGELTVDGLTYADASSVEVHNYDPYTGQTTN